MKTGAAGLILLAAGILLACTGCAKMAEPRPPEIRIPKAAVDLAVRQVSDYVVLSVSRPVANTNGSEPVILKNVEVYRLLEDSTGAQAGVAEQQFLKQAQRILSIAASQSKDRPDRSPLVFQDRFAAEKQDMYSHTYRYAVLFVNNKNQSAGLSNQVSITPVPIPLPPAGLAAQGTQEFIRLKWEAPSENMDGSTPPHNAGYNIYRTEDPKNFPAAPLNSAPVTAAGFEDRNFRFEATYYYAITTVGSLQQPYPESLPSGPISLTTKDVFPPAPPADFSALVQENTIVLLWEPSAAPDVAGYRIYRKEKGTEERRLVQSELVRGLSFRDAGAESGKQYEYEIQAIDAYGNASLPVKTDSEQ